MNKSIVFDQAVEYYDETRGYAPGVEQRAIDAVEQALGLAKGSRILEVGIGTGRVAVPLSRRGYDYFGCDLSIPMMQKLRAKLQPNEQIKLAQADVTLLPYKSQSFAAVVVVHVFHLVPDTRAMVEQIKRVLQLGAPLLAVGDSVGMWRNSQSELGEKLDEFLQAEGYTKPVSVGPGHDWARVRQILQEAGATEATAYTAFTWEQQRTTRQVLDGFARRIWSGQWSIPDQYYQPAMTKLREWVDSNYAGQLDEPLVNHRDFNIDRFRY